MKTKKILVIGIITFMSIMLFSTISKAGVESKPGGTVWTNITISNAYKVCYDMRAPTSTLGLNSLDSHLALNKDWGAVAYLALSTYGAVKDATGPTGVAVSETSGWYSSSANYFQHSYPCLLRTGVCGYSFTQEHPHTTGGAYPNITFRPAIWN